MIDTTPGPDAPMTGAAAPAPEGAGPAPEDGDPAPAGAEPAARTRSTRRGALLTSLAIVAVLAGAALFVSGWTLGRQSALTPGTPASEAEAFQPFWDTYRAVTERYAGDEIDRRTIIEGAIKGMIAALGDPYSQYLTSEEFKASLRDISNQFEGIGATIGTVGATGDTSSCDTLGPDCRLAIIAPLAGSPAELAGLLPGDVVTRIDGAPLDGLTVAEARDRIRGPRDTTVVLTIERGDDPPRDVELVRAVITSPDVETRDLADGTVGYIRLSGFSDHAVDELEQATASALAQGRSGLILDLRGNNGGFVTAARSIASQFLDDGTVFWQEDADGNLTETVAEPGGAATDPSVPLVVLVDGGTASAAEIVAGALQDRGRAALVGTRTYGKGTVQQWTQLEGDHGGFRLTVAKWLTPNRTWVHGTGITPDVEVTSTPDRPGDDPALDAALELLRARAAG
jgi:carboxyl-terminal processing protease